MPKFTAFLFASFFISSLCCQAQYFERIYPNTGMSHVGSMDNCLDSGYIICGSNGSNLLLKIKQDGDTDWIKNDAGAMVWSNAVVQNSAGNFVVVGSGPSQVYSSVAMINTYDSTGSFISADSIIPDDGWGTYGISITRSPNRDYSHYWYYIDGFTASNYTVLDNGSVLGGDLTAVGQNSVSMNNTGQYCSEGNLQFDLDTNGTWRNNILRLSGTLSGYYYFDTDFTSCALTADGGVMVAGVYDTSGTTWMRMIEIDATGSIASDNFIPDTTIKLVYDMKQTDDGNFAILCSANNGGDHIVFLSIDSTGALRWRNDFYGNGTATPVNFTILRNGFAILGTSNNDPYIIRTDSLGRTNTTNISAATKESADISIYPNPTRGMINIALDEKSGSQGALSVYDLEGRIVFDSKIQAPVQQLNLSFLSKGVYQVKVTLQSEEIKNSKLVVE